ncbi:MAG: DUF402 domain-containing protein, partial [Nocardioidaceae bacterium]
MHKVRAVYRKYDGKLHWHEWMLHLGEDEHGVWLGAPPENTAQRGDEPPVVAPQAHVLLLPRDQWWTASFNAPPQKTEVYCDITSPVEFADGLVTMVDLDLDVIRRRNGKVLVDDEDEFAEHQVRYGYPAEVVANATAAARWLVDALGDGTEPFASAYQRWLSTVTPDGARS